jgi:hypothetical protein
VIWFSLDAESVGLRGEVFAIGWSVVKDDGEEIDKGLVWSRPTDFMGSPGTLAWVTQNVMITLPEAAEVEHLFQARNIAWNSWSIWQAKGARMVVDCGYPVETTLLDKWLDDVPERIGDMPYPLFDVSTLLYAVNMDPTGTFDRIEGEHPPHNPLHDARHSARIWCGGLSKLRAVGYGSGLRS